MMGLTREKVLAMDAGENLDRLIAEKVMNWYITQGEYSGKEYWNDENDYSPYSVKDFKPSTDISAAWEVLEKFPIMMIERVEVFVGNVKVNATVYPTVENDKSYTAAASNVPLAICRAALLTTITE